MDPIKEAFARAKQDVDLLRSQLDNVTHELSQLKLAVQALIDSKSPTQPYSQQTNQREIPTDKLTELSKQPQYGLKSSFFDVSTGNRGVPTNQPTNQQTNQRTGNEGVPSSKDRISRLAQISEVLESLDELKKEVRIKFKRLTNQEMAVFAKIYELDNLGADVDYTLLSQTLNLSEISIRDYVRKIISKGIPIEKLKVDNKKILLSISKDLKQVASLSTIFQLREI
jgi:hypothetical protein